MIEFSIKKKEYKIDELTIGQYYKVQNLLISEGTDSKIKIISHLSGCPVNELKTLDQYQFIAIWNLILDGPLKSSDDLPLQRNFILNSKFYGFMEFSKMSIGEFSDMEVLKADPLNQSKLHVMMAILYRPATSLTEKIFVVEAYDSSTVMERAEEFLDMPLKYVYGALNFFLRIQKILLNDMLHSLTSQMPEEMMMKLTKEQKELTDLMILYIYELQEIGQTPSTWSQTMISPSYEKLQQLTQSLYSTTSPILKTKEKLRNSLMKKLKDKINYK